MAAWQEAGLAGIGLILGAMSVASWVELNDLASGGVSTSARIARVVT